MRTPDTERCVEAPERGSGRRIPTSLFIQPQTRHRCEAVRSARFGGG
jgi:hypothetical protein